jgi:hypothetical protein
MVQDFNLCATDENDILLILVPKVGFKPSILGLWLKLSATVCNRAKAINKMKIKF